jgi:predicted kinase
MLIGVPASGKTTWFHDQFGWDIPSVTRNCAYISTDHYVEKFAKRMGGTYSEVFSTVMPRATRLMNRAVQLAIHRRRDIVWDQTNLTVKSRKNKLHLARNYYKIAIVFPIPEIDELQRRLDSRPGKHIPKSAMEWMIGNYQPPTIHEGFDAIQML